MTRWLQAVIAASIVLIALSVASYAVRDHVDWHEARQPPPAGSHVRGIRMPSP